MFLQIFMICLSYVRLNLWCYDIAFYIFTSYYINKFYDATKRKCIFIEYDLLISNIDNEIYTIINIVYSHDLFACIIIIATFYVNMVAKRLRQAIN